MFASARWLAVALVLVTCVPVFAQGQTGLLGVNSQSGAVQAPAAAPTTPAAPALGSAPLAPRPVASRSNVPQPFRFIGLFGVGIIRGLDGAVQGTAALISDPVEGLKGLGRVIANPGIIVGAVSDWVGRLGVAASSDPDAFAEMLGEGAFTAVSTAMGGYGLARGATGLVRAARGASTASLAGDAALAASTSDDLARTGALARPVPTRAPVVPTVVPTRVPTVAPTRAPPTVAPTRVPPPTPTVRPTRVPPPTPTVQPTRVPPPTPTVAPTRTPPPTPTPTVQPTRAPRPVVRPPDRKLAQAIAEPDGVNTHARSDDMITRPIQRNPNLNRHHSEFPYRLPQRRIEIQPGRPLDPRMMKPGEKWLYVVREDGVIVAAPEAQAGWARAVKHRDLVPSQSGMDGLPARYGGEMVLRDGKIVIDGNSSYVFQRKNSAPLMARDRMPAEGPLWAVRELFEASGMPVETSRAWLF